MILHRTAALAPHHGFLGGGVGGFTGAGFGAAAFLGFFFSLLCEWLPFPIVRTSVPERESAWTPPIRPPGESGKACAGTRIQSKTTAAKAAGYPNAGIVASPKPECSARSSSGP